MPSFCPKCHRMLDEDEVCCAEVGYTWRCRACHKVTRGPALPYGRCFLCGGEVEDISGRDLSDAGRLPAIHDALALELHAYYFYRLALARIQNPQQRLILESLYQNEVDHLEEIEQKYHAPFDRAVLELTPQAEAVLADRMFAGIDFSETDAAAQLYEKAIEMERRTRDHFRAAAEKASGLERDVYLELAAEEEEHVAMLETEMSQFN
jgi:glutamate synthase (NADPH/NADH) small chain